MEIDITSRGPIVDKAVKCVARTFHVGVRDIYGEGKTEAVAKARMTLMAALLATGSFYGPKHVARLIGRDRTAVLHAARRVNKAVYQVNRDRLFRTHIEAVWSELHKAGLIADPDPKRT